MPVLTVSAEQARVPGPGIVTKTFKVLDQTRPNRIQMNISDQFEKIALFLAKYGRESILKDIATSVMASIVGAGEAT